MSRRAESVALCAENRSSACCDDAEDLEIIDMPETNDDKVQPASRRERTRAPPRAFQDAQATLRLEIDLPSNDDSEKFEEEEPLSANDGDLRVPETPANPSLSYDEAESVFNYQGYLSETSKDDLPGDKDFADLRHCVIVRERSLMHRLAGKEFYFLFLETENEDDRCESRESAHEEAAACHSITQESTGASLGLAFGAKSNKSSASSKYRNPRYELLLIAKRDRRKERVKIYDVCKELCTKTQSLVDVAKDNIASVEASASGTFYVYDCFDQAAAIQFERATIAQRLGEGFVPRSIRINLYPAERLRCQPDHQNLHRSERLASPEGGESPNPTVKHLFGPGARRNGSSRPDEDNNDNGDLSSEDEEQYSASSDDDRDEGRTDPPLQQQDVSFMDVHNAQKRGSAVMEHNRKIAKQLAHRMRRKSKQRSPAAHQTSNGNQESGGGDEGVERTSTSRLVTLANRPPLFDQGHYKLNFHGRVKRASSKNMQIVEKQGASEKLVMQFGKVSSHRFTLDFQQPLSTISAFGIALTQFF